MPPSFADADSVLSHTFYSLAKEHFRGGVGSNLQSARVNIPQTILFEQGFAKAWFSSHRASDGADLDDAQRRPDVQVKRKLVKDISSAEIYEAFAKGITHEEDIAAYLISSNKTASKPWNDSTEAAAAPNLLVQYFTKRSLKRFLFAPGQKPRGVLQAFVSPQGTNNSTITATYTQRVTLTEGWRSKCSVTQHTKSAFERAATIETTEDERAEMVPTPAAVKAIRKLCSHIVQHIHLVEHVRVVGMLLLFKVDRRGDLRFLYCLSMKLSADTSGAVDSCSTGGGLNLGISLGSYDTYMHQDQERAVTYQQKEHSHVSRVESKRPGRKDGGGVVLPPIRVGYSLPGSTLYEGTLSQQRKVKGKGGVVLLDSVLPDHMLRVNTVSKGPPQHPHLHVSPSSDALRNRSRIVRPHIAYCGTPSTHYSLSQQDDVRSCTATSHRSHRTVGESRNLISDGCFFDNRPYLSKEASSTKSYSHLSKKKAKGGGGGGGGGRSTATVQFAEKSSPKGVPLAERYSNFGEKNGTESPTGTTLRRFPEVVAAYPVGEVKGEGGVSTPEVRPATVSDVGVEEVKEMGEKEGKQGNRPRIPQDAELLEQYAQQHPAVMSTLNQTAVALHDFVHQLLYEIYSFFLASADDADYVFTLPSHLDVLPNTSILRIFAQINVYQENVYEEEEGKEEGEEEREGEGEEEGGGDGVVRFVVPCVRHEVNRMRREHVVIKSLLTSLLLPLGEVRCDVLRHLKQVEEEEMQKDQTDLFGTTASTKGGESKD